MPTLNLLVEVYTTCTALWSVGGSFGNARRIHGDRALQHHLKPPSGFEKHSSTPPAVVNEDQGDRDPNRRGGDSNPYGRSDV